MRRGNRKLAWWVVAAGIGLTASAARADEGGPSRTDLVLRKLGRGIANVATCPLEIPRTAGIVGRADGYFSGATVGLLQGVWRTLQRGAVGVFEVVTCFAEVPKGYAPLFTPEFVWAHGNWAE